MLGIIWVNFLRNFFGGLTNFVYFFKSDVSAVQGHPKSLMHRDLKLFGHEIISKYSKLCKNIPQRYGRTERTDSAVENDGSLVIGEFVDEREVQFWSCRRESNYHRAKRGRTDRQTDRRHAIL